MKLSVSHELKNLTPLPTGRQATPSPLNPPKGEIPEREGSNRNSLLNLKPPLWYFVPSSIRGKNLRVTSIYSLLRG
jgi:hypothetical protein